MKKRGIKVGRYKVRQEMRQQGLVAIQPKGFKPKTTDSRHDKRVSPNLIRGSVKPERQVIVGDITYIGSIADTWVYLAQVSGSGNQKGRRMEDVEKS